MSLEKSSLVLSRNVSSQLASTISARMGIPLTANMGKYLGTPSIHKMVNKETYTEVVECMQAKLQGWKSKCLSLAGRVTFIKSVTAAIPSHII